MWIAERHQYFTLTDFMRAVVQRDPGPVREWHGLGSAPASAREFSEEIHESPAYAMGVTAVGVPRSSQSSLKLR